MGRIDMHTVPFDTVNLQKRRQSKRAVFRRMAEKAKLLKNDIPGAILVIFLGLAECYTLPSPFPFCFLFAALHCRGKAKKGCIMGSVILLLLRIVWGLPPYWMDTIVMIAAVFLFQRKMENTRAVYGVLLGTLILTALPRMLTERNTENICRQTGSILLGLFTMPAILRSVEMMSNGLKNTTEDDTICLAVPLMILLCGAAHISILQVNIGLLFGGMLILLCSWFGGAMMGAVAGIGAGFAVMSAGQHALYLLIWPMAGFLCGCFREKKRLLTACAYAFAGMALVYLFLWQIPQTILIHQVSVSVLFLLIPGCFMKRMRKGYDIFFSMKPKDNAYLRLRMQQWVKNINKLAKALPVVEVPLESTDDECEEMVEKLCNQCDRLPICWHEQYEQTKQSFHAILAAEEIELPLINQHFHQCERIKRIPEIMEVILWRRKETRARNQTAAYERDMMEAHLLSLSQAAQRISLEGLCVDEEENEKLQRGEEALLRMHFAGKMLFAKKIDGHWTCGIQSDLAAIHYQTAQRIAKQVGRYMGVCMDIVSENSYRIILEESPLYEMITGQATVCAAVYEKCGISANGDAVLIQTIDGGKVLFALSDGMGHGIRARNESNRTLEMMAVCFQAGYDNSQTMKVVNGAMLNATGGESFATLDMGVIDLWSGETEMCKFGACSSFLIQGQKIHRLSGEALPLGILEHVYPAQKRLRLYENDRILLMSDGVSDMFESDEEVIRIVQKALQDPPQAMAEFILQEALDRQQNMPKDDMTVLCVQLAVRHPKQLGRIKNIPA